MLWYLVVSSLVIMLVLVVFALWRAYVIVDSSDVSLNERIEQLKALEKQRNRGGK